MNKHLKNVTIYILALFIISCDRGFEELNTDPINPTETTVDRLFAGYLSQTFWNYDYWANNAKFNWMNWTQQITSTSNQGLSVYQQAETGKDNIWSFLYTNIFQTYRVMELELEKQSDLIQEKSQYKLAAMKIVLFSYVSKVTDLYGDIPFSEAARGLDEEQILFPKYDSQESIYKSMLDELKDIHELFATNDETQLSFRNTEDEIDLYYNNDWTNWHAYANSLRLRLAMRLSEVDPSLARSHVEEILNNNLPLIESNTQHAEWNQNLSGYESVGLNDAHRFDEAQGQRSRASERMWSQLADGTDNASIFDIRANIFFSRNAFGQWAPIPSSPLSQVTQNIDIDILFDPDIPLNYSILTPKFMGGRKTTERHFLSSEISFLKAEAYWRGWANGDAQTAYEEGIRRSIEWYVDAWNDVNISTQQIEMPSEEEIAQLLNNPKNSWDEVNGLELIITQKWIDFMLDPLEAYSDYRRTGFPVLDISYNQNEVLMPVPNRFAYPQSESIDNQENYQSAVNQLGEDSPFTKVWWDKN